MNFRGIEKLKTGRFSSREDPPPPQKKKKLQQNNKNKILSLGTCDM